MPVEHDDEATAFDPNPWGAMQRVLPNARFTAGAVAKAAVAIRTSGPLQSSSVAAIAPLSMPGLPSRMPAATPSAALVGVMPSSASPPAVVRATVPLADLPLTAFGADVDCTLPVRRALLTARSLLAVPLGAALAAIVILVALAGSSTSPAASASVRATSTRLAVPVLAPSSIDVAASGITAGEEARLEAGAPSALIAARALSSITEHAATPRTATPARKRVTSKRASHGRPRKIVAVDASTPLGNLRPGRF